MKRILIIFFILVVGYLLINVGQFFGKKNDEIEVTDRIKHIEIDVASVSTKVIPEPRDSVKVSLDGRGKVSLDKKGNTIEVEYSNPVFTFFSFFNQPKLTIYIPDSYDQNMEFSVGSGNVEFLNPIEDRPYKLNELTLDIGSGNIYIESLEVDRFVHDGGSGNVEIHSLTANDSKIDLSSGNLEMYNYKGKLKGDVSSGNLNIEIAELVDSIDLDVSSGNIELDLPDDADFTLNGDVGSGTINYDFPLTMEKHEKKSFVGKHKSGKHKIDLDVSSGRVNIY